MSDIPVSVLIVSDAPRLSSNLAGQVLRRGCQLTSELRVAAVTDAALSACDAVVMGVEALGPDEVSILGRLVARAPGTPFVVAVARPDGLTGRTTGLPGAVRVARLTEEDELVTALQGAVRRRRGPAGEQRLVWELQIVNEVAEIIGRSLELDGVLAGALRHIVAAYDGACASIRLRSELTGNYEVAATAGSAALGQVLDGAALQPEAPSGRVVAARTAIISDGPAPDPVSQADVHEPAIRSVISVPMFTNGELLGTLSIGAARAGAFDLGDERLLAIIAGQIGVAVQNARLHETFRRGKREWEQTFDAITDPVAVFDAEGRLLRGNAALAALLGRPVTALRHTTCRDVGFCGGTFPRCVVGDSIAEGRATHTEVTTPNGQIFSVTTLPVGGGTSGPSVVQIAKNMTEEIRSARRLRQMSQELAAANARLTATVDQLKSTQAQLLQAEKLSAIGQLVAGVAHELNNPLTSVIGYAQLLEQEFSDPASAPSQRPVTELAEDLRRIAEESARAARIVRNLLAFARRQSAARSQQDIVELVTRVLALRAYELRLNSIELSTRFQPELPPVMADGSQIQQAVLNLVLNAEQAMRGRPVRQLTVAVRFDEAASGVKVSITDTGHGIDDATLLRIFDPFFTTREVGEGTGLGLSICYGIIREHGGQIQVKSRVQSGTTFSLLLPARPTDALRPLEDVLVAHADLGDRDFIAAALAGWGFQVARCGSGEDALARYRAGGLHAALVDRTMVAGDLAGWMAARAGVATAPPLILLARAAEEADVDRFGREQASVILTPPFQLRTLLSAVTAGAKEYV